jgi:Flp pilus assembly protein TadG
MRLHRCSRRGSLIPMTVVVMLGLFGLIALAFDLGLVMLSRNQCQNAADCAAMAGARTLNGDSSTNNNYNSVLPNASQAVSQNFILGKAVDPDTQMTLTIGDYYYDTVTSSFKVNPSGRQPGNNWTLVQATVRASRPTLFGNLLGVSTINTQATATAAHRPRDAVIVVDFSGSMRFESLLGAPYSGARTMSMNPDTVYPTWGHYQGNASRLVYSANTIAPTGEVISDCNVTVPTKSAPVSVISGFYADPTPFGTTTPAFTPAPSSLAMIPEGDVPLLNSRGSSSTYSRDLSSYLGSSNRDWRFELDGYSAYSNGAVNATTSAASDYANVPFHGYTQGPGYYGKTFFLWPPDPRVPLTTTYYTSNASLTSPGQIQQIVRKYMLDFGFNSTQVNATTSNPTNHVWVNWTSFTSANALRTYLTGPPPSGLGLSSTDSKVLQLLRLYNRAVVNTPGLPKDAAGRPLPCDWRTRFFLNPDGTPLTDSSRLYNSNGTLRAPSNTTYLINYNAILYWIKNSGPNPFPNQLRAGGIVYYTAIPDTINTNVFPPNDPNQRFWKEYIDEVLGVQQTGGSGSSPTYNIVSARAGYGDDFVYSTAQVTATPSGWPTSRDSASATSGYINYTDNPRRPLLRMWFGPLSLVDYLGNYNGSDRNLNNSARLWWPGTVAETPTYQTKLAIQAALKSMLNNHPNDKLSLIFFSSPKSSATGTGYYNYTRSPLGRDERSMINSLWFSPKTNATNSEITLYNSSGQPTMDIYDVPRANGGTCYAMPLMLAYNQFSSNPSLVNYTQNAPPGTAGGLGRNGSNKLLIFETDGMVNTGATATLVSSGNGTGYYRVRIADINNYSAAGSEFPSVSSVSFTVGATQSQAIAQQICNSLSAGGFSTARKPVNIHCIAFGSLFDDSNSSTSKTNALSNLAALEVIGKVQPPGATTLASDKIIVGDFNTRITRLQAALNSILQDGVQVSLISSAPNRNY